MSETNTINEILVKVANMIEERIFDLDAENWANVDAKSELELLVRQLDEMRFGTK